MLESGGLLDVNIPGGEKTSLPALPLEMNGHKFGVRHDLPHMGAQGLEILKQYGYSEEDIEELLAKNIVGFTEETNER